MWGNLWNFNWKELGVTALTKALVGPGGSAASDINLGSANFNAFANNFTAGMASAIADASARISLF